MAKVIEFYVLDLFFEESEVVAPKISVEKVIEFPKEKLALGAKADQVQLICDRGSGGNAFSGRFRHLL